MLSSIVFIEETGDSKSLQEKAVRTKIRQHARGFTVKSKAARHPIIIVNRWQIASPSTATAAGTKERGKGKKKSTQPTNKLVIPPPIPAVGYERARILYNADLMHLSALTSLHVGAGASLGLAGDSSNLGRWITTIEDHSYLDFVPYHYSRNELIRATADCVMARVQLWSSPRKDPRLSENVLKLYTAALKQMQQAIDDPRTRLLPTTLLATALLQLFEVLEDSPTERWANHTTGLMRLIALRNPEDCTSEVEIGVIKTQAVVFAVEAIAQGEEFFFERPAWVAHFTKYISASKLGMLVTQAKTARLIRITGNYIARSEPDEAVKESIIQESQNILDLSDKTKTDLGQGKMDGDQTKLVPNVIRSIQIARNRCLVALEPASPLSVAREAESLEAAEILMAWHRKMQSWSIEYHPNFAIFVAMSAQKSMNDWAPAIHGNPEFLDQKGCLRADIYERWRRLMSGPGAVKRCIKY